MKRSAKLVTLLLLVVMVMAVCLTGCAPKTPDDAKAKLEKKGYTVTVVDGTKVGITIGGLQATLSAFKSDDKLDTVNAMMFDTKENAEKYFATVEKDYNESKKALNDEIKAEKDADKKADLEAVRDAFVLKKSGNWIAMGNKDGIKAFLL